MMIAHEQAKHVEIVGITETFQSSEHWAMGGCMDLHEATVFAKDVIGYAPFGCSSSLAWQTVRKDLQRIFCDTVIG